MKVLKPKEVAEILNVHIRTLQRWDNEGVLKAHRNPKGRRFYTDEQIDNYLNKESVR